MVISKKMAIGLLFAACIAVSCDKMKDGPDQGPVMNNYVRYYISPTELFVTLETPISPGEVANLDPEVFSDIKVDVRFFPAGTVIGYVDGVIYGDPSDPEFNRLYDSLSTAHGDTQYSKKKKRYPTDQFIGPAVYRRMKLDVVSDTDYDAIHPAGSLLNDVMTIKFSSVKEIIESGYDFSTHPAYDYMFGYEIREQLAQFNDKYRKLVGSIFDIRLTKAPAATSVHRFTVTYTDEDGRTFSSVTSPVKIKGVK